MDEDEVEFLDSVLESTRAEEDRVKKETAEGLALFRQQQEEADKKARRGSGGADIEDGSPVREEELWVAGGKKRKRTKEKEVLKGVKIRRASTADESAKITPPQPSMPDDSKATHTPTTKASASTVAEKSVSDSNVAKGNVTKRPPIPQKSGLGLVSYGSDSESD